jgi:hypothetical protein
MIFNAECRQPLLIYRVLAVFEGWRHLGRAAQLADGGGLLRCGARTFAGRATS